MGRYSFLRHRKRSVLPAICVTKDFCAFCVFCEPNFIRLIRKIRGQKKAQQKLCEFCAICVTKEFCVLCGFCETLDVHFCENYSFNPSQVPGARRRRLKKTHLCGLAYIQILNRKYQIPVFAPYDIAIINSKCAE